MKRIINFFKIIFLTNLPYNCTGKESDNSYNETYQSLKNLKKQILIQIEDNNDRQTRNFDSFKNDF